MKIKFLAVISLAAAAGLAGCGGDDKANVNANGLNTNVTNTATAPAPAARDAAAETVVKEAMTKKGFTDVTVEATASEVILRGSVPTGKMTEAIQAAQEAAKRKVTNQLTEK